MNRFRKTAFIHYNGVQVHSSLLNVLSARLKKAKLQKRDAGLLSISSHDRK
jgi:hypothetical protein